MKGIERFLQISLRNYCRNIQFGAPMSDGYYIDVVLTKGSKHPSGGARVMLHVFTYCRY